VPKEKKTLFDYALIATLLGTLLAGLLTAFLGVYALAGLVF
jgi:hypothetical protein